MQTVSSSEENVVSAMQDLAIKSPKAQHSPKPPKTPRSCRSVWQAHGGGMAVPHLSAKNRCSDMPSQVLNYEPAIPRSKRGRSPPPLDRNSKPKTE